MPEFNPQVPEQNAPDWSRQSKGTEGDQSFGTLFKGIGQAVSGLAQTGDNYVKNTIEDASRYSKESIDNEMGFNSQQYNPEIAASGQVLQKLQAARTQGKISDEYYYQRLSNTMKGLRARFPGYEKEVDQIFSRVTGTNPANAFRDALIQQINAANASAQQGADWKQKQVWENAKYLTPNQMDPNQVQGGVDGQMAIIAAGKQREYQAETMDKQAKYDSNASTSLYNQRTQMIAADSLSKTMSALGMDQQGFVGVLQKFGDGKQLSPEGRAAATATIDQMIVQAQQQMVQLASGADGAYTKVAPNDIAAAQKQAISGLTQLKELITQDKYDEAAQLAANIKMTNDRRYSNMVQANPWLGNLETINKLGGPEIAGQVLRDISSNHTQTYNNFVDGAMTTNYAAGIATGQTTSSDMAKGVGGNAGMPSTTDRAQSVTGIIQKFKQLASDPRVSPEATRAMVNKEYSMDVSQDALWKGMTDSDKVTLFQTKFDPGITKKIADLKDPAAMAKYQGAAMSYLMAIPEFREAAGTTGQRFPFEKYLQVQMAPDGSRLIVGYTPDSGQMDPQKRAALSSYGMKTLTNATESLNKVIGVMKPMWEAQGIAPEEGVKQVLSGLGGKLGGGDGGPGFFTWAYNKLLGQEQEQKSDVTTGGNSTLANTDGKEQTPLTDISSPAQEGQADLNPEAFSVPDAKALEKFRTTGPINDVRGGDAMLSLIGRAEGTDKTGNGYNTSLANGALLPGGKEMNLTSMTIGQIRDLQRQMLQSPNNRWNSSALGRYQIVGKTLQGLIDRGVVSLNDKFDEATQDKLAKVLIEDSGYSAWKSGKMSDAEFSRNLSGQWASLANTSGRTFYKDQPRVGATAQEVLSAAQGANDVGVTAPRSQTPEPAQAPTNTSAPQEALMAGMPKDGDFGNTYRQAGKILETNPSYRGPGGIYGALPEKDTRGENQIQKFLAWNPDPVGNEKYNLNGLNAGLAKVYEKAKQDNPDLKFVLGVGRRYDDAQKAAVSWGWSKTLESDHKYGEAMDVWPLNEQGQVIFDKERQEAVAYAMKKAAVELGINIEAGADFKKFKDLPHFAVKH